MSQVGERAPAGGLAPALGSPAGSALDLGPARPTRARVGSPPAALVRVLGLAALAASVGASVWIAVGASDGRVLVQLPHPGRAPAWIDGPLRPLASLVGSLPLSSVSISLSALALAYLVALACSRSIQLRHALVAVVLANVAFTLCPTLVSTDVFGYIAYAREAALHGLNPYVASPSAVPHDSIYPFVYWKHAPTPYGPLFTGLSVPLGLLSKTAALWTYKALTGAASIAIAFMVARIARARGLDPTRAAILVGLNPILLFYAVSGAHNDLLGLALIVCALWLAIDGRSAAGAGVAVTAAAVKVTLGLALPFLLIGARRRGRAVAGAAVAIVVLGLPTLLLYGTHIFGQVHKITTDPVYDISYSGPAELARALGSRITTPVRDVSTGLAALCALAALVWAWRGKDWVTAAGWAFLALIASIASLAPWYLVWVLPFAALSRSRALTVVALAATGYLVVVHMPALGYVPWLSGAGS
jgi:hypothetical protein